MSGDMAWPFASVVDVDVAESGVGEGLADIERRGRVGACGGFVVARR
jgi:hypothetical protein